MRTEEASEDSGCICSSRRSCLSASRLPRRHLAFSICFLSSPSSSARSSPSPSSCWICLSCSRKIVIALSLAHLFFGLVLNACLHRRSSSSRVSSSLTFFNLSIGSKTSRIAWLSSILSRRFNAHQIGEHAGIADVIGDHDDFRRQVLQIQNLLDLLLRRRISASTSIGTSGNVGSITFRILISKMAARADSCRLPPWPTLGRVFSPGRRPT